MSLDLRPDTTTLSPTSMRRNDVIDVEFWVPDTFDPTGWSCQVRSTPNASAVAATWAVTIGPDNFDDLPEGDDKTALADAGVDNTFLQVLITFDATDLEGPYRWDVEGEDGNTLFGAALVVDPDVTRVDGS